MQRSSLHNTALDHPFSQQWIMPPEGTLSTNLNSNLYTPICVTKNGEYNIEYA